MLSAKRRSWTSCAFSASRMRTSSSMSVITANAPPIAAADLAVGEQRDAHPAQLAGRLALAPLVGDGRARERALDVALHLGQRLAGEHVLQHAAEEVVGRDADPVAERLVGEADLELPVEVEDRRADAVGDEAQPVLALPRLELEPLQVVDVGVGRRGSRGRSRSRCGPGSSRRGSRSAAGPGAASCRSKFVRSPASAAST